MKKCFFLLSIILIVILIYSGTKVTKKSYLVLGIDSNLDYINDKKSNLEKNNKLLNFNTKYHSIKKEMKNILTAKANVDRLLGEDSVEKEKEKSQKQR